MTAAPATIEDMSDDAAMEELLAPIRERNRGKLLARLDHVRAAIDVDVPARDASPELRGDLHALVGALGTYGWPAGSDLMTRVQAAVAAGRPARDLVPDVDALIARVRTP